MKVLLLLLLGAAALSQVSANAATDALYEQWNESQLQRWLKDHNVPVSYDESPSREKLLRAVRENYDSAYNSLKDTELKAWLQQRGVIPAPKSTREELIEQAREYANSAVERTQKVFNGVTQDALDSWDESALRNWLLQHNVVAPSSKREQLLVMAKQKKNDLQKSASSLSSTASSAASSAYQKAGEATAAGISRLEDNMDDAVDYVYSTWDDNRLRDWLVEHGVIKPKTQAKRDALLAWMKDAYARSVSDIWEAWSDSFIRKWLIQHGIIKPKAQATRDQLLEIMKDNYYTANDKIWDNWSESELRDWLIGQNLIKPDRKYRRHQLERLVSNNYQQVPDVVFSSWKDSDMRQWLIDNGYLKSDERSRRDDLVKLMKIHYEHIQGTAQPYLSWSDARLKGWLREHDIEPPSKRDQLLQAVRDNYVATTSAVQSGLSSIYSALKDTIAGGVEIAEDKVYRILNILHSGATDAEVEAEKKVEKAKEDAKKTKEKVKEEL